MNGEIKHDMFPDWSEVMAGYRVDSRQLHINNSVTRNQPMRSEGMVRGVQRDNLVAGDWSTKQTAGVEPRGSYVSTLTINQAALHNTTTNSTAAAGKCYGWRSYGRSYWRSYGWRLLPMGEKMRDDGLSDGGESDDPGNDPGGGVGATTE